MAFDEMFVQVLELLQRQGWVSYRTLRRRFGLDEAALAALTQALLETQPVTVDDTGSHLVWQGEPRPAATPTWTWDVVPAAPSVAGAAPWPLGGDRSHRLSPLVGRAQEVALLRACWAQVQAGQGQVVALQRRGRHWQVAPGTGSQLRTSLVPRMDTGRVVACPPPNTARLLP